MVLWDELVARHGSHRCECRRVPDPNGCQSFHKTNTLPAPGLRARFLLTGDRGVDPYSQEQRLAERRGEAISRHVGKILRPPREFPLCARTWTTRAILL